jgi:fructose/tagatose bisphosphate aldolase
MQSLRQTINEYKAAGKAIGHFNFSDSNQLMAIAQASKETGLPVIAGLSEGERDFFPIQHARALVDIYQSQGINIFLKSSAGDSRRCRLGRC